MCGILSTFSRLPQCMWTVHGQYSQSLVFLFNLSKREIVNRPLQLFKCFDGWLFLYHSRACFQRQTWVRLQNIWQWFFALLIRISCVRLDFEGCALSITEENGCSSLFKCDNLPILIVCNRWKFCVCFSHWLNKHVI